MIGSFQAPSIGSESAMNAFNVGAKLGGQASPFTALGNALLPTLQKYDAGIQAAQTQNNAMDLQGSKNQTDIEVAKIGAGYPLDGSPLPPDQEPSIDWKEGPNGEPMYSTIKYDKGRKKQSDYNFAPKPESAEQKLKNSRAQERLDRREARKAGAAPEAFNLANPAQATVPTAQPKMLDKATYQQLFKASGGDRMKAIAAAKSQGYQIPE